jgi:hypothetical protein
MAGERVRFQVFKRDNFRCQYCGRSSSEVILELDHVVPKSKGGIDDFDNYITSCRACNIGKSNLQLITIENKPNYEEYSALCDEENEISESNRKLESILKLNNRRLKQIRIEQIEYTKRSNIFEVQTLKEEDIDNDPTEKRTFTEVVIDYYKLIGAMELQIEQTKEETEKIIKIDL